MSDEYCLICYVNKIGPHSKLKCGFSACEECLINWIEAEAKYEFIKVGAPTRSIQDAINKQEKSNYSNIIETIKCMNASCQKGGGENLEEDPPEEIEHRLTYEECLDFVQRSPEQRYRDMYGDVLLQILTPNSKALQKCPRQGCDYTGFVDYRRKCTEDVACEKCYYTWSDPDLLPFCKKLRRCLCGWDLNFSLFNNLQKVVRSQACPGCGICIIKGPGCKHMNCQNCRHEFCWYCLGDYPSYTHKGVLWCPFRILLKVIIWLWLILFTWNLQLIILFPSYGNFMISAGREIGILLLANVMTVSVLLLFLFYGLYEAVKNSSDCCSSIFSCFFIMMTILWPFMWVAGLVVAYIYWPLARVMAWYLLWQWVTIIGLAFMIVVLTLLIKSISGCLQRRRDRKYYAAIYQNDFGYADPNMDLLDNFGRENTGSMLIMDPMHMINESNLPIPGIVPGAVIPLPPAPPTGAIMPVRFTRDGMDNLEGISHLFAEEEENKYMHEESTISEETLMIEDQNLLQTHQHEIYRKTLGDIFSESKLDARPRNASF